MSISWWIQRVQVLEWPIRLALDLATSPIKVFLLNLLLGAFRSSRVSATGNITTSSSSSDRSVEALNLDYSSEQEEEEECPQSGGPLQLSPFGGQFEDADGGVEIASIGGQFEDADEVEVVGPPPEDAAKCNLRREEIPSLLLSRPGLPSCLSNPAPHQPPRQLHLPPPSSIHTLPCEPPSPPLSGPTDTTDNSLAADGYPRSDIELATQAAKTLERILQVDFYAPRGGLQEKLKSSSILHCSRTLAADIQYIASVRNDLAHIAAINEMQDRRRFVLCYESVRREFQRHRMQLTMNPHYGKKERREKSKKERREKSKKKRRSSAPAQVTTQRPKRPKYETLQAY